MRFEGTMGINCFVAMAFGDTEADQVYDRCIAKNLRAIKVDVYRVDRVEHNNNIDDQIMLSLSQCEMAIVDLTFARPSVYFEAGYAESRGVPVVYTCRADHFKPRVDDPGGNLRVHFDLQMRNIIAWRNGDDEFFKTRLRSRVKKIIAPLLKARQVDSLESERRHGFARLSIAERVSELKATFASALQTQRYKRLSPPELSIYSEIFGRKRRDVLVLSIGDIIPHATPTEVNDYCRRCFNEVRYFARENRREYFSCERYELNIFLASPEPLSVSKVRKTFTHASTENDGSLIWKTSVRIGESSEGISKEMRVTISIVGKVLHPGHLEMRLQSLLKKHSSD